uniref:Uncharacterized protein n=1 Tax=Hyaloperonospora arabidopsidis (strain Emoy2) TaxID=559515 RepID=M4BDG6_HYAAE
MAGLLSRSEQFDLGDRGRLTRSRLGLTTCSNVPRRTTGRRVSGSVLLYINNRYWILGEFSSWDRAHAQQTCWRVIGRPRIVGTSSFCRVIRSIVDVPCTRISYGPLLSRAARCAASRSARSAEKPSPLFTLTHYGGLPAQGKGASFLAPRRVSPLSVVAAGCRLGRDSGKNVS